MKLSILFLLIINLYSYELNDIYKEPYNPIIKNSIINKKDIHLIKYLAAVTIIDKKELKQELIKNKELNNLVKLNNYENLLILENLDLLNKKELKEFKERIYIKDENDLFFKRIYEIKHGVINIPELFKNTLNMKSTINKSINFYNQTKSIGNKIWINKNGGKSSLLNLYLYSKAYSKKEPELKVIFNEIAGNDIYWEYLNILSNSPNVDYSGLYAHDDRYTFKFAKFLINKANKLYSINDIFGSNYYSSKAYSILLKYEKKYKYIPQKNFKLILDLKPIYKKNISKILTHFQQNRDKISYLKIKKEAFKNLYHLFISN